MSPHASGPGPEGTAQADAGTPSPRWSHRATRARTGSFAVAAQVTSVKLV
jgi:hypothetical protein